jgi:putative sterol carrier protein
MSEKKFDFFSEQWLKKYQEILNKNAAYKDAAKDWEGDFIFQIDADGTTVKQPARAYIDLWHGNCRKVALAAPGQTAAFEYAGPLKNWKLLLAGQIDPIKGLMARKFALKGDMGKVMRYTKAAAELVATATKIPTKFPDDK